MIKFAWSVWTDIILTKQKHVKNVIHRARPVRLISLIANNVPTTW